MNLQISFKNFDHTDSINQKIMEKTNRLRKYLMGKEDVSWTCWYENKNFYSEAVIRDFGRPVHAQAKSDNLYKTFDSVVNKLQRQLIKRKDVLKERIHHKHDVQDSWEA